MGNVANLVPFQFKPGQSGNPGGRSKDRAKLESLFAKDMLAAWERGGLEAIDRVMEKDPAAYLRVVASLMPRQLEDGEEGVTRDRVKRAIAVIESWIATGDSQGADGSRPGDGEAGSPLGVQTLPEAG